MTYQQVLDFWFSEIDSKLWWQKDEAFDALIRERFAQLHAQAKTGELFAWRESPEGCLAEIILLDQFSRNMYRDSPDAFASDAQALTLAQFAVAKGFDLTLSPVQRSFVYMPFMHSESKLIHKEAVRLFEKLNDSNNLAFELKHKAIIDRFGRYPHRNQILGRASTAQELVFLTEPGSSF